MKIKIVALCLLCICCFVFEVQAQSNLDCAALQKKITTILTESKSLRIGYSARERSLYVDFEKDAKANTHLLVRQTGKNYSNQTVITVENKTYYAKTEGEWTEKMPSNFNTKAWTDSCNNVTTVLNKPLVNCVLSKDVTITGTPYALYQCQIEKDTFQVWINKKSDKIEKIEGKNNQKALKLSWEFDTPFTITAPPKESKEKTNFGFAVFPPLYILDEHFDGNEPVLAVVDKLPEFKGGVKEMFKFMGQNLKYPASAREHGIQGTIYIGFIVEKDGSLTNFQLKRGISDDCNEEAMRVLKEMNGKWDAGWYGGQKVRVAYTLPTKFKLE